MRNRLSIVQCASVDCSGAFATWSNDPVQYCPACRRARIRESQRRYEESESEEHPERLYDPDEALNQKLESAAFSLQYDAGPEEEAFHPGARFIELEVRDLLEQQYISVDSIFIHNPTGRIHRVTRNSHGCLVLDPPCEPAQSGAPEAVISPIPDHLIPD